MVNALIANGVISKTRRRVPRFVLVVVCVAKWSTLRISKCVRFVALLTRRGDRHRYGRFKIKLIRPDSATKTT